MRCGAIAGTAIENIGDIMLFSIEKQHIYMVFIDKYIQNTSIWDSREFHVFTMRVS